MLHFPKSTSTPFLVPAGTHHAVCYCVADLGTQETTFGRKPQLLIGWEFPRSDYTTVASPLLAGGTRSRPIRRQRCGSISRVGKGANSLSPISTPLTSPTWSR